MANPFSLFQEPIQWPVDWNWSHSIRGRTRTRRQSFAPMSAVVRNELQTTRPVAANILRSINWTKKASFLSVIF